MYLISRQILKETWTTLCTLSWLLLANISHLVVHSIVSDGSRLKYFDWKIFLSEKYPHPLVPSAQTNFFFQRRFAEIPLHCCSRSWTLLSCSFCCCVSRRSVSSCVRSRAFSSHCTSRCCSSSCISSSARASCSLRSSSRRDTTCGRRPTSPLLMDISNAAVSANLPVI